MTARGGPHDPSSTPREAVILDGFRLRGSIDLIERHGATAALRITDHKTGKRPPNAPVSVGGGAVLQPTLYALAAEQLLDENIETARLFYCTQRGDYSECLVPITADARQRIKRVLDIVDDAVATGFLPTAPSPGACNLCDYRPICGPYEEQRTKKKPRDRIEALNTAALPAMTPQPHFAVDDSAARERIHNSLAESLFVEASAGTGKTTELVARMVRVLETGVGRIENMAAVTFTHKAAGELKIRLRQELDRARRESSDPGERKNLEDALERLEEASIGTIHGFCAQILRERPVEAVVDPAFEELTESQGYAIYSNAFRSWFEQKLDEPSPGLRRALARIASTAESWTSGSAVEQLAVAGWKLVEWRDFPTHWKRPAIDREAILDDLAAIVQKVAAMSAVARKQTDTLYASLRPVRDMAAAIERSEQVRGRDYHTLEALLLKLLGEMKRHKNKGSGAFGEGVTREEMLNRRDALILALHRFKEVANADLAASLRVEMWDVVARYDAQKRRAGKLDFVDLLIRARDLVRDNGEVRRFLQDRFRHLFVDEFQDTDPLQAELLLLLAAADPKENDWLSATPKPGKLFLVGDPKQSIYKFRRADIGLYQEIKRMLRERGVGFVQLTRSHRSLGPIQACVNSAFTGAMMEDDDACQTAYSPLGGGADAIPGQPSIVALPAPEPYGNYGGLRKQAIETCQPAAVAGFIEWLLHESGWKIRGDTGLVSITPRHVCVLFRRFTNYGADVTREYIKALEAREVPHLLVGSKSFHSREEVQMLRAALAAIEWPDDELSIYSTLRGYFFAISDAALLRWRAEVGRFHLFGKRPEQPADHPDEQLQRIAEALDFLAGLHRERNRRPIAATLNLLLDHTRAHAGFVLRPGGHQALANVNRVCDLARAFEAEGGISFRGFVQQMESEAGASDSSEAPVLEEGAEGVRLMTVHAAKGLEFPVVILADMTAKLAPGEPERHIDAEARLCAMKLLGCTPWELLEQRDREERRERAEGVRVAYVAATRARDLLVVPVIGDQETEGWVSPLNQAVYPAPAHSRRSGPAPGCPSFGSSTALGWELSLREDPTVRPGLHAPRVGDHEVVWWDPRALRLSVEMDAGLKQQEILAEAGSNESAQRYEEWRAARDEALHNGERKQYDIFTASEASAPPPGAPLEIAFESIQRQPDRPAGPRFGALVHAIMRDAPFESDYTRIERLAHSHGRLLGAPEDEVLAAANAVERALTHRVVRRAAAAKQCHRELPLTLYTDDGRLLEGIADLAFLEDGHWTILDFKTDAEFGPKRAHYERQLRWYALALARLTGQPTAAVLLAI